MLKIKELNKNSICQNELPILVNGDEKSVTGLTKETTVDDIKLKVLKTSNPKFNNDLLDQYGLFEQWQNNERMLNGKSKVYKIIQNWQSLPGNQLTKVKFIIRERMINKDQLFSLSHNKFDDNIEILKKELIKIQICNKKSIIQSEETNLIRKKEIANLQTDPKYEIYLENKDNRIPSNKQFNGKRKSMNIQTQEKIAHSFLKLLNKQNQIIDQQLNRLAEINRSESCLKNMLINSSPAQFSASLNNFSSASSLSFSTLVGINCPKIAYLSNQSDTGISSVNSPNNQFETLV